MKMLLAERTFRHIISDPLNLSEAPLVAKASTATLGRREARAGSLVSKA